MMDGVNSNPNIITIGATNEPWKLDDAILRRFTTKQLLPVLGGTNLSQLSNTLNDNVKNTIRYEMGKFYYDSIKTAIYLQANKSNWQCKIINSENPKNEQSIWTENEPELSDYYKLYDLVFEDNDNIDPIIKDKQLIEKYNLCSSADLSTLVKEVIGYAQENVNESQPTSNVFFNNLITNSEIKVNSKVEKHLKNLTLYETSNYPTIVKLNKLIDNDEMEKQQIDDLIETNYTHNIFRNYKIGESKLALTADREEKLKHQDITTAESGIEYKKYIYHRHKNDDLPSIFNIGHKMGEKNLEGLKKKLHGLMIPQQGRIDYVGGRYTVTCLKSVNTEIINNDTMLNNHKLKKTDGFWGVYQKCVITIQISKTLKITGEKIPNNGEIFNESYIDINQQNESPDRLLYKLWDEVRTNYGKGGVALASGAGGGAAFVIGTGASIISGTTLASIVTGTIYPTLKECLSKILHNNLLELIVIYILFLGHINTTMEKIWNTISPVPAWRNMRCEYPNTLRDISTYVFINLRAIMKNLELAGKESNPINEKFFLELKKFILDYKINHNIWDEYDKKDDYKSFRASIKNIINRHFDINDPVIALDTNNETFKQLTQVFTDLNFKNNEGFINYERIDVDRYYIIPFAKPDAEPADAEPADAEPADLIYNANEKINSTSQINLSNINCYYKYLKELYKYQPSLFTITQGKKCGGWLRAQVPAAARAVSLLPEGAGCITLLPCNQLYSNSHKYSIVQLYTLKGVCIKEPSPPPPPKKDVNPGKDDIKLFFDFPPESFKKLKNVNPTTGIRQFKNFLLYEKDSSLFTEIYRNNKNKLTKDVIDEIEKKINLN